jgi:glycosyltransferase involved in cell wall biosynthesis
MPPRNDCHVPSRSLSVLIIGTSFDFPHGQGASSRVFWYGKGLTEAGADVRIVSLLLPSQERDSDDGAAEGTYDGLSYEYACGTRLRPASFWRRRQLWLRRAARTGRLVHATTVRSQGRCVVLVYSEVSSWILGLTMLSKLVGARSVLDLCEFPLVWRPRNVRTSIHRALRTSLACRLADGIIPISTYLEDYVRRTPGRTPALLRVPIMVDPMLFAHKTPVADGDAERRVLYCGSLSHVREVASVIRIFAQGAVSVPDVRLTILGGGPAALKDKAAALAGSLGLTGRVEFIDRVRREDLPVYMCAAEVLVLPRAAGVFSQAGLPNKLGEYLASGRPVIVTANGDMPLYLRNGVSAYLVNPGDEGMFAGRLRHALEHRDEATAIGVRGREVACREFDYRVHGARLLSFLAAMAPSRYSRGGVTPSALRSNGGC